MCPQSEGGPSGDPHSHGASFPVGEDRRYQDIDQGLQNNRSNFPAFGPDTRTPTSPAGSGYTKDRDGESNKTSGERERSGTRRKGSGQLRVCKKCGEPLTGQFVRAISGTFHLDCFKCRDCGQIVASKFFPIDEENGEGQYPLCETDYFRRLDLLCYQCGGALRGSYITALDRKYHIDHFTCSLCPTVFGAQDSYYEHDGQVYCHYHYSTQFAQRCNGCHTAILKQFVEIFRNGQNQHWDPECYMIHKFWNVRLAPTEGNDLRPKLEDIVDEENRNTVREEEEKMEEKVYRIWSVLSAFEESSAACISDMLLHVSNAVYMNGVVVAKRFICHVDVLFSSADTLDATMLSHGMKGLSYSREAKLLCKKIVAFFALLSKTQENSNRKLGVTQELLSLVTGLAHYLKLLIRICLQGALKFERETHNTNGLNQFLTDLADLDFKDEGSPEPNANVAGLSAASSDRCPYCQRPIEDECACSGDRRWHLSCMDCSNCDRNLSHSLEDARSRDYKVYCTTCDARAPGIGGAFARVTRLQQYVFLLRVALARLLLILRNSDTLIHTSDDPNIDGYSSREGRRLSGPPDHPFPKSDSRSKSYGDPVDEKPRESSYENTLNDVRRLRSTRLDKHLSSTIKKARTSIIMDGPEGRSARPGSAGADGSEMKNSPPHIIEDRDLNGEPKSELVFSHQDALTLDDIPRIVAAEQAREQRPNAYKHAPHNLFRAPIAEPKSVNGHRRTFSGANELDGPLVNNEPLPQRGASGKKYFSELTALEYFIVRHVAVLSMQPLLEGYFTLEDLLGLIESRKPTFWNKLGKAFKNDATKAGKKKGVFGVPLDTIIERDGADSTEGIGPGTLRIPALVDDAITTMRKMDLSVEGVFRKNGNIKRLNETVSLIDKDGCDGVDLAKENVVQVAAILKKYLRELPDPLLTFKLHRLYITSQKISDEEKRRRVLHLTCCLLPKSHRDCLEVLFSFLNWVASFHQVDEESGSKMDIHNLATVIAPNILFTNSKNAGMDDSFLAIEAVHSLIECNEQMCQVPEDLQSILNDTSLFTNDSQVTTKEILKRYGDIGVNGGTKHLEPTESIPSARSKDGNGRALAPVATRIDTDPSQASAWQKESSVRHVQDLSMLYGGANYQSAAQQWPNTEQEHHSPYSQRAGTPDSQAENGRRDWRNSAWGRQHNGSLGVAGAT